MYSFYTYRYKASHLSQNRWNKLRQKLQTKFWPCIDFFYVYLTACRIIIQYLSMIFVFSKSTLTVYSPRIPCGLIMLTRYYLCLSYSRVEYHTNVHSHVRTEQHVCVWSHSIIPEHSALSMSLGRQHRGKTSSAICEQHRQE